MITFGASHVCNSSNPWPDPLIHHTILCSLKQNKGFVWVNQLPNFHLHVTCCVPGISNYTITSGCSCTKLLKSLMYRPLKIIYSINQMATWRVKSISHAWMHYCLVFSTSLESDSLWLKRAGHTYDWNTKTSDSVELYWLIEYGLLFDHTRRVASLFPDLSAIWAPTHFIQWSIGV